jgi:rRNA maturation RNase YbeY
MPGGIRFFSEEIDFKVPHPNRTRRWLRQVAEAEGTFVNELTYVFCSDEYLHRMNVEFLDHDTLTDIITFDTSEENEGLNGELYVSVERVTDNAQTFGVSFEQELARVLVHGILHLCGYSDKELSHKQQMRELENFYISLLMT